MKEETADQLIAQIVSKLAARRKELGLSLNRTAQMAGISHVGLLQIESGERSPLLRTVLKLAEALQIPLHELFLLDTAN